MSNYYDKREAKVNIAHALMNLGWKVYGYKKDESDSMTDYYSPAYWNGIAERNGFVLVVDNNYPSEEQEIKKYNYTKVSFADREKIQKLEAMTQANGATEGEEQNAKILIEKIKNKESEGIAEFEIIGKIPAYMANPGKCIWHIEKDGKIYDKGNALTKFANIPASYEYDFVKMEFKQGYDKWFGGEKKVLTDEQLKATNDFKALILRFERVVNNMSGMGDGTEETEKAGLEQQAKEGYELVTIMETKTKLKMVEIDRKNIQVGDYLGFTYHGGYWKVIDEHMQKGTWKGVQMEKKAFTYEIIGKESRGYKPLKNAKRYYDYEEKMIKGVKDGKIKIYELKEIEVTEEVEKWVKIDKSKTTYNKTEKQEQSTTETTRTEVVNSIISDYELTITADVDTRDNSPLWVVKVVNKLNKVEYKNVAEQFRELKGHYSKFKHGFIFKYDPTEILKGQSEKVQKQEEPEQTTKETTRTPEQETADQIADISVNIITELGIDGSTIPNNEEYKERLFNNIKNNNIILTDTIINCLKSEESYNNLTDILQLIQAGYYRPIKDGFIYDCHFKSWNLPMSEIQEAIALMNISFIDMGNKIGFEGLTAEQTRQVRNISDINGSILFIDNEQIEVVKTNNSDMEIEQQGNEQPEIKTNEEEIDNSFDDILSKFDDIEINNNSRISADDEEFCKGEEKEYKEFIEFSNSYIQYLEDNKFKNALYNSQCLINEMETQRQNKMGVFVNSIVNYFGKKYKVTLTSEIICKKYSIEIDYNTIVSEVIEQLGGYNFIDKAEKEIKDEFKKVINRNKITIKNNKISIENFFQIDSFDVEYKSYSVSYYSDRDFHKLFKAMSHFLYGSNESYFSNLYDTITQKKNDDVFRIHEIANNGIKTLKLFKNGRIDLEFSNSEYARKFVKEYCGYMGKVA